MKIKLNKANPEVPMVVRDSYYFSTRNGMKVAEITLAKDGEYILTIDGNVYSPYEASAKRSSHYKDTIIKLSNQMHQALDAYNDSFVGLAKQIVPVTNRAVVEEQLKKLSKKQYKRTNFSFPQPNKSDVQSDLEEEAKMKFFSIWSSKTSAKKKYVSDNVDEEYNKRVENWNELKRYHESIQDYFENVNNNQYQQEYEINKKAIEDELNGDKTYVSNRFNDLSSKCNLPFDVTLECDYDQKEGTINATASLPSMLHIPETKVVPQAFGKISIKEKIKREIEEDATKTLLGLAYYLAGHLFSLSVHISRVRLSVVTGFLGLYWVEFERNTFSVLSYSSFDPLQDFFNHPHVIDYANPAVTFIQEDEYKQRVADMIKVSETLAGNDNLIVLSIKDATLICSHLGGVDDLKTALQEAKKSNSTVVIANKRYQIILKELSIKNTDTGSATPSSYNQSQIVEPANVPTEQPPVINEPLDPMFEECAQLIVSSQVASTSFLQRNFSIGYNRAERIMIQLKKAGIVGSDYRTNPRCVLINDKKALDNIIKTLR